MTYVYVDDVSANVAEYSSVIFGLSVAKVLFHGFLPVHILDLYTRLYLLQIQIHEG